LNPSSFKTKPNSKRDSAYKALKDLPYVANAFLEEAQQLYVTKILGLSGYEAGTAWNIILQAGVDESTAVSGTPTTFTSGFTGNAFLGIGVSGTGDTGTYESGWELIDNDGNFENTIKEFEVTSYSASTGNGIVSGVTTVYSGTVDTEYDNMVLAVVRSRGDSQIEIDSTNGATTNFETTELSISGNTTISNVSNPTGDVFGEFVLAAANNDTSSVYSGTSATYTVSMNPDASSFLPNVIGNTPKGKDAMIWVQAIYPDLIKKLDEDGIAYGIKTQMITGSTDIFTDYETSYKTPETPWVVSQIKGNTVEKLFKFISISDGDSANEEIKVTIQNINLFTLEFDVVVREFYDTDANPSILETYSKCTMIKGANNYIGQKIGTSDGEYSLKSKYVMVEIADDLPNDVFPAGFEGYLMNNYMSNVTTPVGSPSQINAVPPAIFYKTEYQDTDRVSKTYLGLTELGYTGDGINQNMFDFINFYSGQPSSGFTKSKGFHMDSGATGITINGYTFVGGAGEFRKFTDTDDPTNPYFNKATRKFTFAPAGGFDGWDVNRRSRSVDDDYRQGGRQSGTASPNEVPNNDFQAWEMGIDTFANPEEVTINIFATPGINWADQTVLVQNTIEMIEEQRTDTLYVIDSPELPNITAPTIGGGGNEDVLASTQITDLLTDTEIDSNYSCTYFPWIQIRDTQNNVNVYIPPTGEVVKAMAFTDNTRFPWFAPAGLTRGVTNARKSMYKLSLEARDILYAGRINPMADFADTGTAIFGNKTLQVRESALDRINVRRLLLQIKVLISNIAVRLLFEQNDQVTIDSFLNQANPILDSIKRERGLTDFRIKMDDSNNTPETRDRNELYGEIFLKPTRSLEYIGITFTITPSGANFDDVGA